MNKISIALVLGLSLATACHKDKDKDTGGDSLARLAEIKAKVCACKDKTCTDKVSAELAQWGLDHEKAGGEKPGEREDEKLEAVKDEIASCLLKIEVPSGGAAAGSTDSTGKPGAAGAAAGSAEPTGAAAGSAEPTGAAAGSAPTGAAGPTGAAAGAGAAGAARPANSPAGADRSKKSAGSAQAPSGGGW